jgi:hypothetical protein
MQRGVEGRMWNEPRSLGTWCSAESGGSHAGSLAMHSLQRHSAQAHQRTDLLPPHERAEHGEGQTIKRTKSQPAVTFEEPQSPKHGVRRSASLHSIADALTAIKADEGVSLTHGQSCRAIRAPCGSTSQLWQDFVQAAAAAV